MTSKSGLFGPPLVKFRKVKIMIPLTSIRTSRSFTTYLTLKNTSRRNSTRKLVTNGSTVTISKRSQANSSSKTRRNYCSSLLRHLTKRRTFWAQLIKVRTLIAHLTVAYKNLWKTSLASKEWRNRWVNLALMSANCLLESLTRKNWLEVIRFFMSCKGLFSLTRNLIWLGPWRVISTAPSHTTLESKRRLKLTTCSVSKKKREC